MEDFLEFWLEDIMRPEMTDPSYVAYRNAIVKHINPHLGNTKLIKLSRGNVQQFYNKEFKISESVAKLVKTIMKYVNGICSGQEDDFCQSGRRE